MNCGVGIPNIQVWIESPRLLGILINGSYHNTRQALPRVCRPPHPTRNASTDTAFVIEQQSWRSVLFDLHELGSFHDSYGCLTKARMFATSGLGPSSRPTTARFRNMTNVGVPK